MTAPRDPDVRIAAFFDVAQPELPDRTFEAIRRDIGRARQRIVIGPVRVPGAWPAVGLVATAAGLAIAVVLLQLRPGLDPGMPTPAPTSTPAPSLVAPPTPASSAATSPSGPTRFTSPFYGYTVTVPAGWLAARAFLRWDGVSQPGPDAEADKFGGPGLLTAWAFAAPFDGDLASFVEERIAATARDHADTCPVAEPDRNEPLEIRGRPWVLLSWNCGALINLAFTVDAGVGYAFTFRDLAIKVASDPVDRALFLSILDSVELPA